MSRCTELKVAERPLSKRKFPFRRFRMAYSNSVVYRSQHFLLARRTIDVPRCCDLISLQTLLCIIIFLLSTSRITAAHSYIGVVCSSALRLGLHCRPLEPLRPPHEQRRVRARVFVTIQQLDAYIGLVLGIPPFIDLREINDQCASLHSDSSPVRSMADLPDSKESIREDLSLQLLQLLHITASGLNIVFPRHLDSNKAKYGDQTTKVNVRRLEEVGDQFKAWAKRFSSFVRHIGDTAGYEV